MRRQHVTKVVHSPTSAEQYPPRDPDFYLDVAKEHLGIQMDFVDAIDNKIGLLVSVASGLMGILAAVFALRSVQTVSIGSAETAPFGWPEILTLTLAGCAYLIAAVSGLRAYFLRSWKTGPPLLPTWNLMWSNDNDRLIGWKIANIYRDCYEQNREGHTHKSNTVRILFIAVVIQSLLVALALTLVAAGA